jgi:hypothetical protein
MIAALFAVGCTNATTSEPSTPAPETETTTQALGESSRAYWFEGNGAGLMPGYDERVAWHFMNQVRMNTDVFDIRDMDDNLIPPNPPLVFQPGIAEVGRWQGAQSLEYACYCVDDPMSGMPVASGGGQNPYTCCTAGYVNGTIRCVGPVVGCGDDGMMRAEDRWGLLNRGPGEINNEFFWATEQEDAGLGSTAANFFIENGLGLLLNRRDSAGAIARTSIPLVPDNCLPPEDSCDGGQCMGPNGETSCDPDDPDAPNECIGMCDGGPMDGEGCTIPAPVPDECDPETYPKGWYWTLLIGRTTEPVPFINDAIHAEMAEGVVTVLTNYYDPAGEPETLQVVTDSECNDLSRSFERPSEMGGGGDAGGADAGADMGMEGPGLSAGNTYQWDGSPSDGCIRYMIHAVDAEGFEHTYPTYGSLGMRIIDGHVAPNDETCPIWAGEERPAPGCLPAGDECTEGATRVCYTGRPGTQDKGVCEAGTETCENGRWSGLCVDEVRPEVTETCGDDEDDNCNGYVDEDCPIVVGPGGDEDMGDTTEPDMGGGGTEDAGTGGGSDAGNGGGGDDDGGCCATLGGSPEPVTPLALIAAFLGLVAIRRRQG